MKEIEIELDVDISNGERSRLSRGMSHNVLKMTLPLCKAWNNGNISRCT
jgi:hypothetical protein